MDRQSQKKALVEILRKRSLFSKSFLLTDYDGTLAPLRIDRKKAYPYSGIKILLKRIIQDTDTNVIIISGRPATEVYTLLDINPTPCIWGSYGLDKMSSDGIYEKVRLNQSDLNKLSYLHSTAGETSFKKSLEIKPFSVAVHWRGKSEREKTAMLKDFLAEFDRFRDDKRLKFSQFNGGIELGLVSANKKNVIDKILHKEAKDCFSVYLGDDVADEGVFEFFKKAENRYGILSGKKWRKTNADFWLIPPHETEWFFKEWLIAGA